MVLKTNKIILKLTKLSKRGLSKVRGNKKLQNAAIIILLLALLYLGKSLVVAAWANNRPIFRISVLKELEKQGGKSVLDNLIEKSLIYQEAKSKNISVTTEDIDKEIEKIKELVKGQGISLEDALSSRGQTMADLKEQIKVQKYVESILSDKVYVSEEDIKKYFDENKSFYGKDETLEKVKDQITQQLSQQKLSEEYQKWIDDLKAKAKIYYFVKY